MSSRGNLKKLKSEALSKGDILQFAEGQSDFAFEMEILRIVTEICGPKTKWGGLYCDPNTKKQREFDIQAIMPKTIYRDNTQWINLAIECKNLSDNFPLVIFCTPRTAEEEVMNCLNWVDHPQSRQYSHYKVRAGTAYWFYQKGKYVGRSLTQVGKDEDNNFCYDDSATFDKWSQALSSLHGMLEDVLLRGALDKMQQLLFLPIVVVPDKTLWQVNFSEDGVLVGEPEQVDSIDYWVDVSYHFPDTPDGVNFSISHLHFFTKSGLRTFIENPRNRLEDAFNIFTK